MIGLMPDKCCPVEDAYAGAEAAIAGGFRCAAMGDTRDDVCAACHVKSFGNMVNYVL